MSNVTSPAKTRPVHSASSPALRQQSLAGSSRTVSRPSGMTKSASSKSGFAVAKDHENVVANGLMAEEHLLPTGTLLCLLAESEQKSRDLEDTLSTARRCLRRRMYEKATSSGIPLGGIEQDFEVTFDAQATAWLPSKQIRVGGMVVGSIERAPSEKSLDTACTTGSSYNTAAASEAATIIREALLQLEPMIGNEILWGHLGALVEEHSALRIQVTEQSRRNKLLRREVQQQSVLSAKIEDLEQQNRLFAARIPESVAMLRQRERCLRQEATPERIYFEGLVPPAQVDAARSLWERHRMVCEELMVERSRRRARYTSEKSHRHMVPLLFERIDAVQKSVEASLARMVALEEATVKSKVNACPQEAAPRQVPMSREASLKEVATTAPVKPAVMSVKESNASRQHAEGSPPAGRSLGRHVAKTSRPRWLSSLSPHQQSRK